ncbi:hypothetical protein [Pseudonocardia spinosispora]|uniref:hypothetical protein n=1 Tax=Pseudonocardia spinosispora TaxID=103441 RepID=UPI0012EB1002|nr:hypothetical protein [Pseudonocardia spinosispora]
MSPLRRPDANGDSTATGTDPLLPTTGLLPHRSDNAASTASSSCVGAGQGCSGRAPVLFPTLVSDQRGGTPPEVPGQLPTPIPGPASNNSGGPTSAGNTGSGAGANGSHDAVTDPMGPFAPKPGQTSAAQGAGSTVLTGTGSVSNRGPPIPAVLPLSDKDPRAILLAPHGVVPGTPNNVGAASPTTSEAGDKLYLNNLASQPGTVGDRLRSMTPQQRQDMAVPNTAADVITLATGKPPAPNDTREGFERQEAFKKWIANSATPPEDFTSLASNLPEGERAKLQEMFQAVKPGQPGGGTSYYGQKTQGTLSQANDWLSKQLGTPTYAPDDTSWPATITRSADNVIDHAASGTTQFLDDLAKEANPDGGAGALKGETAAQAEQRLHPGKADLRGIRDTYADDLVHRNIGTNFRKDPVGTALRYTPFVPFVGKIGGKIGGKIADSNLAEQATNGLRNTGDRVGQDIESCINACTRNGGNPAATAGRSTPEPTSGPRATAPNRLSALGQMRHDEHSGEDAAGLSRAEQAMRDGDNAIAESAKVPNTTPRFLEPRADQPDRSDLDLRPFRHDGNPGPALFIEPSARNVLPVSKRPAHLLRQDHNFHEFFNYKGELKSHLDESGNLYPANPNGTTTIIQHITGKEGKSDSPYTSWSGPESSPKDFGGNRISLDRTKVENDIASGLLPRVEVVSPEKIQELIRQDANRIAGQEVNIDLPPRLADDEIKSAAQRLARSLPGLNATQAAQVMQRARDLANTRRDNEWLTKGIIPKEYIKGPHSK